MKIPTTGVAKRLIFSLVLAGSLGGCAYYGPPSAYDTYPYGYGTPTYVGPPVSIDLGFGYYDFDRIHRGDYRGHNHYGYRGGAHHGSRGFRPGGTWRR